MNYLRRLLLSLLAVMTSSPMNSDNSDNSGSDSDRELITRELITIETLDEVKGWSVEQALIDMREKYKEHKAIACWTCKYFRWLFKQDLNQYPNVCVILEKINANKKFSAIAQKAFDGIKEQSKKRKNKESDTLAKRGRL